jgi:hypothetical protein
MNSQNNFKATMWLVVIMSSLVSCVLGQNENTSRTKSSGSSSPLEMAIAIAVVVITVIVIMALIHWVQRDLVAKVSRQNLIAKPLSVSTTSVKNLVPTTLQSVDDFVIDLEASELESRELPLDVLDDDENVEVRRTNQQRQVDTVFAHSDTLMF